MADAAMRVLSDDLGLETYRESQIENLCCEMGTMRKEVYDFLVLRFLSVPVVAPGWKTISTHEALRLQQVDTCHRKPANQGVCLAEVGMWGGLCHSHCVPMTQFCLKYITMQNKKMIPQ